MKCPECGLELSDFYRFCSRCGAILASPIDVNDHSFDEPKRRIAAAISQRRATDRIISPWWVLFILIVLIVAFFVYIAFLVSSIMDTEPSDVNEYLGGVSTSMIVFGGLNALVEAAFCVLAYLMISRVNKHFRRERILRTAILDLVKTASVPTNKYDTVAPEVYQMEASNNVVERERNALIWTIGIGLTIVASAISVISLSLYGGEAGVETGLAWFGLSLGIGLPLSIVSLICTLYVLYFLSKDFYEHDGRWHNFSSSARVALTKLGFPSTGSYKVSRLPERSMVVYIVLSIFIGIFIYYWWYADLKDPNEHFKSQWEFEDHLLRTLKL